MFFIMRILYTDDIRISAVKFIVVANLVVNSISWYYLMLNYLEAFLSNQNLLIPHFWRATIFAGFFLAIPLASLVAEFLFRNKSMREVLFLWITIDIATLLLPKLLDLRGEKEILIFGIWLGFSVGSGFPRCLEFFNRSTAIEERGRVGGAITFLTYLLTPLFLATTQGLGSTLRLVAYVAFRGIGFGSIPFIRTARSSIQTDNKKNVREQTKHQKNFILYFVPWAAFSLIDGIDIQVYSGFYTEEINQMIRMLIHLTGGFSAIFGGVIIDLLGRRGSIAIAMVILGFGFIALSLAQDFLITWQFFSIATGIAWGILSVVYVLVLWGELGSDKEIGKYYAIGTIPLFISRALGYILSSTLSRFSSSHLYSVVTLLNFIAVIPLLFADEVLPSGIRERRRMKRYISEARKVVNEFDED